MNDDKLKTSVEVRWIPANSEPGPDHKAEVYYAFRGVVYEGQYFDRGRGYFVADRIEEMPTLLTLEDVSHWAVKNRPKAP